MDRWSAALVKFIKLKTRFAFLSFPIETPVFRQQKTIIRAWHNKQTKQNKKDFVNISFQVCFHFCLLLPYLSR